MRGKVLEWLASIDRLEDLLDRLQIPNKLRLQRAEADMRKRVTKQTQPFSLVAG